MSFLRSDETKVLLVLAIMLVGLELGARVFEVHLSKDVKHIRSLPTVAAGLKSAPKDRLKVLIIGNSLSRDGFDQGALKEGLARLSGREVELAAMHPDASSIGHWFYGYRRYFDQTDSRPDIILLGTGRPHLLDGAAESDRLAAFYTSLPDMPRLLSEQSGDVEAISKALMARSSILFAHRGRVQPLLFYNLVPGYTETSQTIGVNREPAPLLESVTSENISESCTTFKALLKTLQASHTKLLVIAIPMPTSYTLPSCVLEAAKAEKVSVIAGGSRLNVDSKRFPDGYHLDQEGATNFTRWLLGKIEETPEVMQTLR